MIHSRKWMRNPIVFSTIFCMTNSIGIGWDTYLQVVSQKPCLPSSEWHNEFLVLSKMLCHHGFFSRGQQVVHRNVYRNSISNTLNQNMHERIGSSFTNNFLFISNIWQSQKRVSYFRIYSFFAAQSLYVSFHFIFILHPSSFKKRNKKNMIF